VISVRKVSRPTLLRDVVLVGGNVLACGIAPMARATPTAVRRPTTKKNKRASRLEDPFVSSPRFRVTKGDVAFKILRSIRVCEKDHANT